MSIATLDPEELECLKTLSMASPERADPCPRAVIRRLLERRLIEPIPLVWLPVPIARPGIRLTAAGQLALRESLRRC